MLKAKRFLVLGLPVMVLAVSASLTLGLTLSGCGAADEAGDGVTLITQVDLTRSVPAPLTGDMVLNTYPVADAGYEERVVWTVDGKEVTAVTEYFAEDKVYAAAVALTPKEGYAFAPNVAVVHKDVEDTGITPVLSGSSLAVGIVFSSTDASATAFPVTDLDLTAKVLAPVTGTYPIPAVWMTQYTGPVQWYLAETRAGHSGAFRSGTGYIAEARLTLNNESFYDRIEDAKKYVFGPSSVFFHDSAHPFAQALNSDGSVTVTMYFPAADTGTETPGTGTGTETPGTGTDSAVTDLDLTARIPAPVTGASPVPSVGTSQYTGPLAWSKTADGGTHNGVFQPNTAYTATATLKPVSGYAFAGTPAFTHSGAALAPFGYHNDGGTFTVTIKFPAAPAVYHVNAATGNDNNAGMSEAPFKTLQKALDAPFAGGTKTIYLIGDLTVSEPLAIGSQGQGGTTTITSADDVKPTITRTAGQNGSVIEVTGGEVVFKNITIDGRNTGNGSVYNRGLKVTGTGTRVTLGAGTVVTGKVVGLGGGILAESGTTLVMLDGSAVKDSEATKGGGGVYLSAGGTFTMTNAKITGNNNGGGVYGEGGGGVHVSSNSTFEMNGGEISKNNSRGSGGGVYAFGTFTMTNGKITGNTANNNGGGVIVYHAFTMTNSEISGNTARWGGGVDMSGDHSKFEMNGGAISGNTATGSGDDDGGGGVTAYVGSFIINGGTISNNKAPNGAGGGILIAAIPSDVITVIMNSGTISGNTAGTNGGGVYVYGAACNTFTMTGGTIYGTDAPSGTLKNTANGGGAALYKENGGTATKNGSDLSTTNNTIQ